MLRITGRTQRSTPRHRRRMRGRARGASSRRRTTRSRSHATYVWHVCGQLRVWRESDVPERGSTRACCLAQAKKAAEAEKADAELAEDHASLFGAAGSPHALDVSNDELSVRERVKQSETQIGEWREAAKDSR